MDEDAGLIRERKARAIRAALDIVAGIVADVPMHENREVAVRRALGAAAFALMAHQGLDAVTPTAIAKAAHVPLVTFRGCFSGVEEAVLSVPARRWERVSGRDYTPPWWLPFYAPRSTSGRQAAPAGPCPT